MLLWVRIQHVAHGAHAGAVLEHAHGHHLASVLAPPRVRDERWPRDRAAHAAPPEIGCPGTMAASFSSVYFSSFLAALRMARCWAAAPGQAEVVEDPEAIPPVISSASRIAPREHIV